MRQIDLALRRTVSMVPLTLTFDPMLGRTAHVCAGLPFRLFSDNPPLFSMVRIIAESFSGPASTPVHSKIDFLSSLRRLPFFLSYLQSFPMKPKLRVNGWFAVFSERYLVECGWPTSFSRFSFFPERKLLLSFGTSLARAVT